MTEQDPWATPPDSSARTGGMRPADRLNPEPAAAPPPASPGYAHVPPAAYGAQASTEKDWMGVTSLVLSLATLIVGFTWIGGIIFGHMGLAAAKRGEASNRGIALAGTIIGWVFAGLTIIAIVGLVVFFAVAEVSVD